MKIGKIVIKASRWPWQEGYDWKGATCWNPYKDMRPLGRFGHGWRYKLGVDIGRGGMTINLLFGSIELWWSRIIVTKRFGERP